MHSPQPNHPSVHLPAHPHTPLPLAQSRPLSPAHRGETRPLNPGTDEIRRLKIPLIGAPRWRLPSALRCDPIDEAEEK